MNISPSAYMLAKIQDFMFQNIKELDVSVLVSRVAQDVVSMSFVYSDNQGKTLYSSKEYEVGVGGSMHLEGIIVDIKEGEPE